MIRYEAPAKLNLSLLVQPGRPDGYHPLHSVVQTVEWCDSLEVVASVEDSFEVSEPGLEGPDNLVWKAVEAQRAVHDVPPLSVRLSKEIPSGSGLGGGSSDAAAALFAISLMIGVQPDFQMAAEIGADVALFLEGGTQLMTGIGDRLERLDHLEDFAVAIAVPDFELSTPAVYTKWDALGGPVGHLVPSNDLPGSLREHGPIRNDLLPAALAVEERLGDFMSDLERAWGRTASLTGSGSACFGYFQSLDEATAAAESVASTSTAARGVALRRHGVA